MVGHKEAKFCVSAQGVCSLYNFKLTTTNLYNSATCVNVLFFLFVLCTSDGSNLTTVDEATYKSVIYENSNTTIRDRIFNLTVTPIDGENSVRADYFGNCFDASITCR